MIFQKPKFWDIKNYTLLSLLLLPFSIFVILNNWLSKRTKKKEYKIKSICIGNIYLGGTGKTPLTIEIFEILKALKLNPVMVKKYYKNQKDEQRILKKRGYLITKTSRSESLLLAQDKKHKVAIIDDGLQDRSIDYSLKIVCFDKQNFIGNGKIIPAGPLRESLENISSYDLVFFNGIKKLDNKLKIQLKKINKNIKIFETFPKLINLKKIKKSKNYLVFSGIGNPSNFENLLIKYKYKISKVLKYPDHYNYSNLEISKIKDLAKKLNLNILTTEKDY